MPEPIVHVWAVTKEYAPLTALDRVDLRVEPGESVGLLGSNGAGKTTLFHLLMGFLPFEGGDASIFGVPAEKVGGAVRERVAFLPEESGLPPWATPREVARLYADLYRRWDRRRFDRLTEDWEIPVDQRAITLSKGERRLAEIALSLSIRPELLLLDEPFHGLDAVMRVLVREEIERTVGGEGVTLLYSTHILPDVEKIARRIVILRAGRVALDRPVEEIGGPVEEVFRELYGIAVDGPEPEEG